MHLVTSRNAPTSFFLPAYLLAARHARKTMLLILTRLQAGSNVPQVSKFTPDSEVYETFCYEVIANFALDF